jgi:protein TonB
MDSRRTRRLLIAAFALSLLVHLIIASGLRWPSPIDRTQQTEIVRVATLTRVTHAVRVPTPAPHTPPPPTASPSPVFKKAAPASGTKSSSGAGAAGTPAPPVTPVPTPVPAPAQTPAPCEKADIPAAVASPPPPPELTPEARAAGTSGIARVRVSLDPSGAVQNATVASSSGSNALDLAAMSMARNARYTPALHLCKAVAADYIYSVKFQAW